MSLRTGVPNLDRALSLWTDITATGTTVHIDGGRSCSQEHLRQLAAAIVDPLSGSAPNNANAPACRPNEYSDFAARLRSFRAFTWFAKPAQIGPLQCARWGWKNSAKDTLHCSGCETHLSGAALGQDAAQLNTAHGSFCPWRDDPCPPSFLSFPLLTVAELLEGVKARYATLLPLLHAGCLPSINAASLEPHQLTVIKAVHLAAAAEIRCPEGVQQSSFASAVLAAICGWRSAASGKNRTLFCPCATSQTHAS